MNKSKNLLFIAVLILLAVIPSAFGRIDEYHTKIDVGYETSTLKLALVIDGGEIGISSISLPFSFYPKNIVSYNEDGLLKSTLIENEMGYTIIVPIQIKPLAKERIYLEFERANNSYELDNRYIFGFQQTIPENTLEFNLLLKLPEGAVLANLTEVSPVSPEPQNIGSDGRRITLAWNEKNTSETIDFRILVAFEKVVMQNQTTPTIWLASGLIVISTLILAYLSYFLLKKRTPKIMAIGLDKDEKRIYEFVLLKKETKQKTIQKELEFSKPRLSKLLRKLEEKGLIEKKIDGRSNLIKIKKQKA